MNRDYDLSHLQLEFLENACKILTRVTKNVLKPSSVKMIEEFGKESNKEIIPPYMEEAIKKYNDQKKETAIIILKDYESEN